MPHTGLEPVFPNLLRRTIFRCTNATMAPVFTASSTPLGEARDTPLSAVVFLDHPPRYAEEKQYDEYPKAPRHHRVVLWYIAFSLHLHLVAGIDDSVVLHTEDILVASGVSGEIDRVGSLLHKDTVPLVEIDTVGAVLHTDTVPSDSLRKARLLHLARSQQPRPQQDYRYPCQYTQYLDEVNVHRRVGLRFAVV